MFGISATKKSVFSRFLVSTKKQGHGQGKSSFKVAKYGLAPSLALLLVTAGAVRAETQLLKNGGLEQADSSADEKVGKTAHWTGYKWEGYGRIKPVSTAVVGKRAMLIEGSGPAKQAIFQHVELPACHYRLRAVVAGRNLRPNGWKQSAAVYISFESGGQVFQDIFKGDSDWHEMELNFEVKKATGATLYFFNYGSGSFFVDHIRLAARKGCKAAPKPFMLSKKIVKKLVYEAPPEAADLVLAGYCSDKSFVGAKVCRHLRKINIAGLQKKRAAKKQLIADFAGHQPFEPGEWQIVKWYDGKSAARIFVGNYMIATPKDGLPGDWSGYDWLTFETNNPGMTPQKVYVEIHDKKSSGYWSRVNYYTMAPPGRSRHKIPLQIFVGEKSVIQNRRRLDLAQIVKLVFSAHESQSEVEISDINLDLEQPYKNDFLRLLKFDVGPPTGPLFYGFTALHPGSAYRPARGYGYSSDVVQGRTEDRRHPGNLLRDWTSLTKGGIDIDLPNGQYQVWMMLEDPGYWEYYPNFTARKVQAEGKTVLDEKQNARTFLKKFYRHANDEDLPGDDIWKRYIRPRYKPLRFAVNVHDGQLNLRFEAEDNPYALALSALLIYPKRDQGRGEAFIKELWAKQKQQFNHEYRQILPPEPVHAEPAGNALDTQLSVFQRSAAVDVHSNAIPQKPEQVSQLSLQLSRGETAPLTLSLRAKNGLQLEGAVLELPGLKTSSFKVRAKVTRRTEDGSVYQNAPRLLDPLKLSGRSPLVLVKKQTRRLSFDVSAPSGTKVMQSNGKLQLKFRGGRIVTLPVHATIHPWRLPKLDIAYGYLGIAPNYPGTPWHEVEDKKKREMHAAIALLEKHGMNSFSGGLGGPVFNGYEKGRVQIDFSKTDESMKLLKGRGTVESYLGLAIEDLLVYQPDEGVAQEYGKPYAKILRDVLKKIRQRSKKGGWPTIRHVVGDEPDGSEAVNHSLEAAKAFKAARVGVKTSIFTSIANLSKHANRLKFAGNIDLIYLNNHSEAAISAIKRKGSDCALYNMHDRYHRGIYLLKIRQLGCRGHMQFAFNSAHVDHWYDLDGREGDQVAAFTHPDGELRPALELKRYAMAITDYRYLLKLEQTIKNSRKTGPQKEARAWLSDLLVHMKVGLEHKAPWTPEQLDAVREKASELINRLR